MKRSVEMIPVKELLEGYLEKGAQGEDGVTTMNGRVLVTPPVQRGAVWEPDKQKRLVRDVLMNTSIAMITMVVRDDGIREVTSGQQRIRALGGFLGEKFSIEWGGRVCQFSNLYDADKEKFISYEVIAEVLEEATHEEIYRSFVAGNIPSIPNTKQEMLNGAYQGCFVETLKKDFSSSRGQGVKRGKLWMAGKWKRQEFLETALHWASDGEIESFMAKNQHEEDAADEVWNKCEEIMDKAEDLFPVDHGKTRARVNKEWGRLVREYGHKAKEDGVRRCAQVAKLMETTGADGAIRNVAGIYDYVLSGNEQSLELRLFDEATRRAVWTAQGKRSAISGKDLKWEDAHADHIVPWKEGGKTNLDNCQVIHRDENLKKGAKPASPEAQRPEED